VNAEFVKDWV
jgi:hypothetical protein